MKKIKWNECKKVFDEFDKLLKKYNKTYEFKKWIDEKGAMMCENPYNVEPYGACPVQAEGQLSKKEYYYFRARHAHWSLEIYKIKNWVNTDEEPIWSYGQRYCKDGKDLAGWISKAQAIKFATKAIKKYLAKKRMK